MREDEELLEASGVADLLGDPLGVVRRRWRWMLATLLLGTVASGVFAYLRDPRYAAESSVMIARQQVSESIVKPTIEEDALTRIDAMAAEVLSDAKLQKVVESLGLHPELRETESMADIVARVRSNVTIEQAERVRTRAREESAEVFTIRFEADRPEEAAGVANAIADLFVEASIDSRVRQHRLTSEFLRRELASTETALRELDGRIAEFKRGNRGTLPEDLQPNLTRLDRLQEERQSLALQIAEAEARMVTLASDDDDSPVSRLEALRTALAAERGVHTDQHPTVIALTHQAASLEREIAGAAAPDATSRASLRQAAEGTIVVLRSQLAATEREIEALDARVERTPQVQEELAALSERASILRESYLEFLRKVQDAELAENLLLAQQGERVSVVNRAVPPSLPIRSRWGWLGAGVALCLVAAALTGLVAETLDPVLVTAGQVEAAGRYPVIGTVGRIA
jgi:uncharacterized protein involved in exopolysaccharide biosynthesis